TLAVTPFLATTHLPLLTPQGTLRGAIETWIRNGVALTIGQEGLETDINANVRMFARGWGMFGMRFRFTDDQSIPMPISTQDKMYRFRSSLYRAMQFDLERMSEFLGYYEVFLVLMQRHIFAILP